MSQAAEYTMSSWASFVAWIAQAELSANTFTPAFIFRGQANTEWGLLPSFARELQGVDLDSAVRMERATVREFQRHAAIHLTPLFARPVADRLSWLGTMQHYGCPTRLLDWTASPYVAMYFAAQAWPKNDGAVWCAQGRAIQSYADARGMRPPRTPEEQNDLLDTDRQAVIFLQPNLVTDRMSVQQTFFTVSGSPLADHEQALAAATPGDLRKGGFAKIIIPKGLKLECLRHLRRMNVTAQTLFPGIDGLGTSLGEAIRLEVQRLSNPQGKKITVTGEGGTLFRDQATGVVRVMEPHEVKEDAQDASPEGAT